jgi:hypothetical protein
MSAWRHLPNAKHIDRVLASLRRHSEIWSAARFDNQIAAQDAAWDAVRHAAWNAARDEAYGAVRDAILDAVRYESYGAAHGAALNSAWGAILALIAYDNCEQYLSMTSEELQVWARLSENPAAVLLLPAVVAFERIAELETV